MAKKKKDRDFQKVRIKVGRTLKRQRETVVDLTWKKIRLPKERDAFEGPKAERNTLSILDDAIASLNVDKSITQLRSIQTLNTLLDPFVKQITTLTSSPDNPTAPLTVHFRNVPKLMSIYQTLFQLGPRESGETFSLQLGTLIDRLTRLCRSAEDPGLCNELCKIFLNIIKLCMPHPTFVDLLHAMDQCAVAMLHRVESDWLWAGCRLIGWLDEARCLSVKSAGQSYEPISPLVDPIEQLVRSSVFSRSLAHLYEQLKIMQATKKVTSRRLNLLRSTLAHFKANQYIMHAAHLDGGGCTHPLLLPYAPPPSTLAEPRPSTTNSHQSTVMCLQLMDMESPHLLTLPQLSLGDRIPKYGSKNKKKTRKARNRGAGYEPPVLSRSSGLGQVHVDCERTVVASMLEQGYILLGELNADPTPSTLKGLLFTFRCLRVLFEERSIQFFFPSAIGCEKTLGQRQQQFGGILYALSRFFNRLYTIFPLQSNSTSASSNERRGEKNFNSNFKLPANPSLSRAERRKIQKKMTKLKNRDQRRSTEQHETRTESVPVTSTAPVKSVQSHDTIRTDLLIHRLNQSFFELFAPIECLFSRSTVTVAAAETSLWPLPHETLVRMNHLLLDTMENGDPFDLSSTSPLLFGWLKAFDFYLLASVRDRTFGRSRALRSRTFTSIIILSLHRLIHRLRCPSSMESTSVRSLGRVHRCLLRRSIGLMTAILSTDQISTGSSSLCSKSVQSEQTESSKAKQQQTSGPRIDGYDESWIRDSLSGFDIHWTPDNENMFQSLTSNLIDLVRNEPPRICAGGYTQSWSLPGDLNGPFNTGPPIQLVDSTWLACLLRLSSMQFAPIVKALLADPQIQTKLERFATFEHKPFPLSTLADQLGVRVLPDAATVAGDCMTEQLDWLVAGFLPSLCGRYASPLFWRVPYDKRIAAAVQFGMLEEMD